MLARKHPVKSLPVSRGLCHSVFLMAKEERFTRAQWLKLRAKEAAKARAAKLTKKERTEIARKAAKARWAKTKAP